MSGAKSGHAQNIAKLDQEAIDTIEAIVTKNKEKVDLTEYIPTLGKNWFSIVWDNNNRRDLKAQAPSPYYQGGDAYGAVSTPSAPAAPAAPGSPAGQSDYYGAIGAPNTPDTYYGGYGAPQAPNAPSTPGYPQAPSTPDATYGYQ